MARIPIDSQELEKVELWRDDKTGEYFFRLEYLCEDESEVFKIIFPKVETGIPLRHVYPNITHGMFPGITVCRLPFNCSHDEEGHLALGDEKGNFMYRETITKKTHEMTMEEIEKKLGYKVKIVSKKEEEKK